MLTDCRPGHLDQAGIITATKATYPTDRSNQVAFEGAERCQMTCEDCSVAPGASGEVRTGPEGENTPPTPRAGQGICMLRSHGTMTRPPGAMGIGHSTTRRERADNGDVQSDYSYPR